VAATWEWGEANAAGATKTYARTDVNWKNIDDSTTAYSSSSITAGASSYTKYQFLRFGGSWNEISSGKFAHTATAGGGAIGTGITLRGQPVTAYALPSTTPTVDTDISSSIAIGSGATVQFTLTEPGNTTTAGLGATVSGPGTAYSQYVRTQLQTSGSAGPGDCNAVTLTIQYNEN
jgi:hypothetical protein